MVCQMQIIESQIIFKSTTYFKIYLQSYIITQLQYNYNAYADFWQNDLFIVALCVWLFFLSARCEPYTFTVYHGQKMALIPRNWWLWATVWVLGNEFCSVSAFNCWDIIPDLNYAKCSWIYTLLKFVRKITS